MEKASVCRLCMNNAKEYILIFDDEAKTEIVHLFELFQLNITPDFCKSSISCMECYLKLLKFQKFHEMCVQNEKLWNRLKKVEVKVEDINEEDFIDAGDDFDRTGICDAEEDVSGISVATISNNCTNEEQVAVHKVEEEQKLYECDLCHRKYEYKGSLNFHMRANHILTTDSNEKLDLIRTKSKQKEKEYKRIQETFDLKCPKSDCDYLSKTFIEYKTHLRIVHNERRPGLFCCGRKLETRVDAIDHINLHLNPEKLQCKNCNRIYSSRSALRRHRVVCHGDTDINAYTCEPCGKRFNSLEALRFHMFIHLTDATKENLRIYKCAVCKSRYLHKNTLRKHIRFCHLNEGIMCSDCGKLCKTKLDYETHRKVEHGGKGPLKRKPRQQCPTCKKWFSNNWSLKLHIQSQHTKTKESQHFECHLCGKKLVLKSNLLIHMIRNHMERAFKCERCPKSFPNAERLKEHTAMHTGIPLYSCPYCSKKQFNRRANMYKHFKVMHSKEWEKDKVRKEQDFNRKKFSSKYLLSKK